MQVADASEPPGSLQLAVRADGHYAAVARPSEVSIFVLPALDRDAQISVDGSAHAYDARWLGSHLLVASHYQARTSLQFVDVETDVPVVAATLELTDVAQLAAVTTTHALMLGTRATLLVHFAGTQLTAHALPSCTRVTTGAAAGDRFLLASAQTIEIWDPETRSPQRRLHLPRPVEITHLGGDQNVVWFTTREQPSRIEIVPLTAGRPFAHELSGAVRSVASGIRDTIICTTASGAVFELGARTRTCNRLCDATSQPIAAACAVAGASPGVLFLELDRLHFRPSKVDRTEDDRPLAAPPPPLLAPDLDRELDVATGFRHLRRRARQLPDVELPSATDWRDELAAWWTARGGSASAPRPRAEAIATLLDQLECAALLPAAISLYAAHLCGETGVAPYEIARCLPASSMRWEEALGRGRLASQGIAELVGSRLVLTRTMQQRLDGDAPLDHCIVELPARAAS
jgi:hypothetical protein